MSNQTNARPSHVTVVLERAANELRELLAKKRFNAYGDNDEPIPFLRRDLPYVAYRTVDGRYLLVHRDYGLLGTEQKGENPIILSAQHGKNVSKTICISADQLMQITFPVTLGRGFFDDSSAPWCGRKQAEKYLQKLELLLQHAKNA